MGRVACWSGDLTTLAGLHVSGSYVSASDGITLGVVAVETLGTVVVVHLRSDETC